MASGVGLLSQSAFMRGFIDDMSDEKTQEVEVEGLNPRSCAASSMTVRREEPLAAFAASQSAFMRGFIDDASAGPSAARFVRVSIRVHARLHR